jgi:Mrp family chromosome partitioning ATPase
VCAVNLAASFAESGQKAILVGADMRRPALERYFGSSRQVDLNVDLGAARRVPDLLRPTRIPGLSVLPGGYQPNPAAVIPEQIERIAACRELADFVVVDTPPVLVANDAVELMRAADAVVLVARVGHTATGAAKQASELLHRLGMPVLGVVILGSTSLPRAYLGYFEAGASVPSGDRRRGSTSASSAGQPRPVAPDGRRGSSRSRPRPGNSSRLLGEPPVGR